MPLQQEHMFRLIPPCASYCKYIAGKGFLWKYLKLFKVTANICRLVFVTFSPIVTGPCQSVYHLFLPLGYVWQMNFLLHFDLLLTSNLSELFLAGCVEHSSGLQSVLNEGFLGSLKFCRYKTIGECLPILNWKHKVASPTSMSAQIVLL